MSLKAGKKDDEFQRMFRFLIDEAPIAVFWMNREAGFTYVNEEACRSLGYTNEELISLHLWDIDPIYKKAQWDEIWENSVKGSEIDTYHIETVHRQKDGSDFPVEIDAKHFWFGETEFHVAFSRDITHRKREEAVLRKYEQIVSASSVLMSIMDSNFVYQAVNECYLSTFGKTRDQIVGHNIADLLGEEAFKNNIKPKLDQCLKGERVRFQHWLEVPGGALRFWDVRYDPLSEADGSISGIGIVVSDITDQKRAEDALKESEERLRLAVKAANVGLYDWDIITNKVRYSPEWKSQIGYAEDKISDNVEEWASRLHPEDLDRMIESGRTYVENPWPNYQEEFRFRHRDGSYRWIFTQASLFFDEQGKAVRMIGSHVDITERKQVEEALKENQRFLSTLMGNLPGVVYRRLNDEDWTHEYLTTRNDRIQPG